MRVFNKGPKHLQTSNVTQNCWIFITCTL